MANVHKNYQFKEDSTTFIKISYSIVSCCDIKGSIKQVTRAVLGCVTVPVVLSLFSTQEIRFRAPGPLKNKTGNTLRTAQRG